MISVVMPVKEAGCFYAQAIQSILRNFPTAEIIVVGPSTAAHEPEIQFDIECGRIRFYEEPRKNLYSAVNLAVSQARFAYIAWLNVDDEMAELSTVAVDTIISGADEIYAFNVEFINKSGKTTKSVDCYSSGIFGNKLKDTWYCYINSMIFRKDLLLAKPFDDSYFICADRKFIFGLARLGPKVRKLSETLVRYRRHEASLTFDSQNRFARRGNSRLINRELRRIYRDELAAPASLRTFVVAATRYIRNLFEPIFFFMVKR